VQADGPYSAKCGILNAKETKTVQPQDSTQTPPTVPKELSGQWIAWNHDGTRIVATGNGLADAEKAAKQAGEEHPRFEKVPRANVRIIGAAR
jgi:hypothetical protein